MAYINFNESKEHPAQKAGAAFRLVLLAAESRASQIYFAGLDGFNEDFSNKHAFTKHVGLKDTDTRRDWSGSIYSYTNVFTEAYKYLTYLPGYMRFQNLGEGFDYNLGTEVSENRFPLTRETKKLIQ